MDPNTVKSYFAESAQVLTDFAQQYAPLVVQVGEEIVKAFKDGKKILIAGNGGSAADAAHRTAELTGRYKIERTPLPAVTLPTNMSAVTAIANDYGYEEVFARELRGLGNQGDIFVGISTSGNSQNIIEAVSVAREKNIQVLLLLGKDGGKLKGSGDREFIVPSDDTPKIQQCHGALYHMLCQIVDDAFTPQQQIHAT